MSISRHFFDHIRQYNSMFAMTSMGAKVIDSINDGLCPYVFKISWHVCHRIGSLIPSQGARLEYAQLYLFDTAHEISNRINVVSSSRSPFHANEDIVKSLIQMLDSHNCRSGFTTLPPVLLQEQADVVLLLESVLVSWSSAIDEHEDLRGLDCRSTIPYMHGRMGLYSPSLALPIWVWAFSLFRPLWSDIYPSLL
jgi:hypothetical protein